MIVREEIELVEEVADVDAAQWIHLRERENTGKSQVITSLVGSVPTNVHHLVIFVDVIDRHWHVVIR